MEPDGGAFRAPGCAPHPIPAAVGPSVILTRGGHTCVDLCGLCSQSEPRLMTGCISGVGGMTTDTLLSRNGSECPPGALVRCGAWREWFPNYLLVGGVPPLVRSTHAVWQVGNRVRTFKGVLFGRTAGPWSRPSCTKTLSPRINLSQATSQNQVWVPTHSARWGAEQEGGPGKMKVQRTLCAWDGAS